MGDINCNLLAASPEYHTKQLNDLLDIYQLTQIINEPTRVTEKSHTLIDLFITNDKENIVSSGVYPLSISDHYLIYAVRKIGIPRSNPRFIQTRSFKHFSKGNFLSDLKNAKWTNLNEICDVNEAWELWKNTFLSVLNKHAPCRSIRKRNKPAPWINSTIKKEMLLRDFTKKKAQKSGLAKDWNEYRTKRNQVNIEVKRTKRNFFQKEFATSTDDPKKTWKLMNDLMGRKSDNTEKNEVVDCKENYVTTPKEIADCFNNHFITVGPELAGKCQRTSIKPEAYLTETHNQFSFTFIKPLNVLKQLNKLDTGKATGVDNIPNKILKIAAPLIFEHLTVIFNKSIALNDFPTDFKVARVSPIFKSGEKNDPSNYRPISVLSCVARVFEKLIYEQLYSYLIVNNLLNPRQSGFRSLHSTVTALLDLTNDWCFNIDRGLVNGVMYLDLKKAFDTVDHALLITKLKFMGLRETT